MRMRVTLTGIGYETDGEEVTGLPDPFTDTFDIPDDMLGDRERIEEYAVDNCIDACSDVTGWLIATVDQIETEVL